VTRGHPAFVRRSAPFSLRGREAPTGANHFGEDDLRNEWRTVVFGGRKFVVGDEVVEDWPELLRKGIPR
jgi:hypothetical protein